MKIICSKEELSHGIQIVQTAVSSKNTLPILSNLVIETINNKVMLMIIRIIIVRYWCVDIIIIFFFIGRLSAPNKKL